MEEAEKLADLVVLRGVAFFLVGEERGVEVLFPEEVPEVEKSLRIFWKRCLWVGGRLASLFLGLKLGGKRRLDDLRSEV